MQRFVKELCRYTSFIILVVVLLIAYLHPAEDHPNRVSNYNKPESIKEIKLSMGFNLLMIIIT